MTIKVTVVRMGSEAKELAVADDSTFGEALNEGGIESPSDEGLRVNGKPSSLEGTVREGDFITYNPKVSGGC